jgi:hypothetical protein
MKIKGDFITNSSSTAYIITNVTNKVQTLIEFVKENPQLIDQFIEEYNYGENKNYNQQELIKSAENENIIFNPGESKYCIFGDEQETLIGHVFDYILRDGGKSKSFTWKFYEYLR